MCLEIPPIVAVCVESVDLADSQEAPLHGGAKPPLNAFVGSVKLDPGRVLKDAGRVVMEVLEHLSTLPDAEGEVTLGIRVRVPDTIKVAALHTVSENAKTLTFQAAAFERECPAKHQGTTVRPTT